MRIKPLFSFIFYLSSICIFAQSIKQDKYESEDAQEQQEYEKEFTYGINWNTNGGIIGGFNFKFAWQTKKNQLIYNLIGLEFSHVVHPKERSTAGASSYGSSYVYGKSNNMFVIRPHFGREWIIFKKGEEEGIQVSAILAAGPSLAYLKPYYVIYATPFVETDVKGDTINSGYTFESLPFDPSIQKIIAGGGSFFDGFDKMTASLGVHAKASLNFEYGKSSGVGGIEIGGMVEQFTTKMIIIPEAENQSLFTSLFINVYFGIR